MPPEEIQLVAVAFPGFLIADIAFKNVFLGMFVCPVRMEFVKDTFACKEPIKPDTAVADKIMVRCLYKQLEEQAIQSYGSQSQNIY